MKKVVLTSIATLFVASPAFAEPSHTSATFPNDEYMLEDYTYTGQATYGNMGVYSGSVNVTADYTNNTYTVTAGTYLPAAGEATATCTAGNFCPGLANPVYYDANNAQGLTSCSTLDGGFTSSDAGATANTDCYKACTTTNVAHSTAVTGNDYYGAGVDTCSATGCENGYHTHSTTQSADLNPTIGTDWGTAYSYLNNGGTDGNGNASTYGLTENNTWATDYGTTKGVLRGRALCSTQSGKGALSNSAATTGDQVTKIDNLTPEFGTGKSCWCQVESYTPYNGGSQSLSGPWVFYDRYADASYCTNRCAESCAGGMNSASTISLIFRNAVLGSVTTSGPAICEPNVITINWTDASADDIAANNAGQCTFGGDIRTPRAAAVKPGKTFRGWKFQKSGN